MVGVNKALDKFGRQKNIEKCRATRGPPGIGFMVNDDGQYDLGGKSLTNVATPKKYNDVATQEYVLQQIHVLRIQLTEIINKDISGIIKKPLMELDERMINLNNLMNGNEGRIHNIEKNLVDLIRGNLPITGAKKRQN